MKRSLKMRMLVVALACLLTACASPRGGESDANVQKQISDATAAWVAAYNSRDGARIAAMYEPDAVLWGTGSATISPTPAAIAEYFKDAAKRPKARVEIVEQHIRVLGDIAFNAGRYTFTNYDGDKPVSSPSRFTFVFHKRNGEWRIVHHHSSRAIAR
jgi:uncharacterized protein (TIGR02246 family)